MRSARSPDGSGLLGAVAYGEGATLQGAADDLVARVLVLAMAFKSGGIGPLPSEGPRPDLAMLEFLYDLGEIAASGCSADHRTVLTVVC